MTEHELISAARKGNTTAFSGLVEMHQVAVFNLCYRMLGNRGEAEDAAQEAFLRAYSQFHRYDPTRPLKTWLLSIASHYCIDCLRRRRVRWCDIDGEPLIGHPALRERSLGPEEAAIRRDQSASIQFMLDQLAAKDRAALVMRYWYDLSYDEIAAATGSTVSAVKSRLHRARETMGDLLQRTEQPATRPFAEAGTSARSFAGQTAAGAL